MSLYSVFDNPDELLEESVQLKEDEDSKPISVKKKKVVVPVAKTPVVPGQPILIHVLSHI